MTTLRVLLLSVLLATTAQARVKLLLFAPGTTALSAMEQIGFNASTFFRAQPRCARDLGTYPCRRKPMDGQFLGHGEPDGQGNCLLPTMYVFAGHREFSVSITINANCDLRFHNFGPVLSFPDDPDAYRTQSLSFPDPDLEGPGIFPQPLVSAGQKVGRRLWIKAKTIKPNGDWVTKIMAGLDIEERLVPNKGILPTVYLLGYLHWVKFNSIFPWRPVAQQFLPNNPTPSGPYVISDTQTASFQNANTNATHSFIAQARMGANAAKQVSCVGSGSFPTDSSLRCEQRFAVLYGPQPL